MRGWQFGPNTLCQLTYGQVTYVTVFIFLVFLKAIQKSLNIHDWLGCLNMDVAVNAS
jgi:hypothetical protein